MNDYHVVDVDDDKVHGDDVESTSTSSSTSASIMVWAMIMKELKCPATLAL